MALLIVLTFVSAVFTFTGAIDYCGYLHENANCMTECPSGSGYEEFTEAHLCTTGVCCKPAAANTLTTLAPGATEDPDTCGVTGTGRVKRSSTGVPSSKCNWPWLVSIRMENTDADIETSHVITGVLVSKKYVLVYREAFEAFASASTNIHAVVGDYYLNMNGDEQNIFDIDLGTTKPVGDFMLLDLGAEVQVTDCVRPICLVDETESGSLDMSQCKLIGWGHTETGTDLGRLTLAPIPLHENVTILDDPACNYILPLIPDAPSGNVLCLTSDQTPSIPQHDAGNPIICPNGNHKWHLKGILAKGNFDIATGQTSSYPFAIDVMPDVQQIRNEL